MSEAIEQRSWARSTQSVRKPSRFAARGTHRVAITEPAARAESAVKRIPADLGARLTEVLMAQGYRETAEEERHMAESDMAAGFETLPD